MAMGYKKALARFEEAVRAHDNKGALPPGDWEGIEQEYEDAKRAIVQKLAYREISKGEKAHNAVEEILYDFLGEGGGNGDTITEYSARIVKALGRYS